MKKIIGMLLVIIIVSIAYVAFSKSEVHSNDSLLLLIPDGADPVSIQGWKNIAAEEGLHLDTLSNKEFLYSKKLNIATRYKGIILADSIQTKMSPLLAERIKAYVKKGGTLLLVFDAGTLDEKGQPVKGGSYFSDVLDLDYAFKNKSGDSRTELGTIGQNKDKLNTLGIPPGKCIPQAKSKTDTQAFCAISSYGYGALTYTYFLTKPVQDSNELLLRTPDHQFIAGVKNVGKGKILFVNLPLTDLWRSTDSMLLHTFLRYLAVDLLHLPTLARVPNGVGGIVLNLHVESKDALDAFVVLEKWGLFKQGPYSIDFTAGPDLDKVGDNKGMDVLHNKTTQHWIDYFDKLGNAIGSDGGWFHDYYGVHVSETNEKEFLKYITMNNDAMEKVLGKKVLEYVPSMGNQPHWATRYLEKEGFIAYYTTSNTGTGPTQNFREGRFDSPKIWSFPILPFGLYSSLRDDGFGKQSAESVGKWLVDSTQFVASQHDSRLIYFHPTDILFFEQYLYSLQTWLVKAKELSDKGVFHWYSMVDLAEFLNSRRDVSWYVEDKNETRVFHASHPSSLAKQAWLIGKNSCNQPKIISGTGTIKEDERFWIVVAGDTKRFEFQCDRVLENDKVVPNKTENNTNFIQPLPAFTWHGNGLITLWFDNSLTSQLTQALPIMDAFTYKAAVSVAVNRVGTPGYLTWDELRSLQKEGWETTSLGLSASCDFSYYTTIATKDELILSKQILLKNGLRANQFVMPCGFSRDQIADHFIDKHPPIVETASQHYTSFRTLNTERSNPLPLLDTYNLKAYPILSTTTDKDIQEKIDQAINDKTWLIFVFQGIGDNHSQSNLSPERFKHILDLINESKLPVVLPGQVIKCCTSN